MNDLIRQLYLSPTFHILCKTRQDLIHVSKFLYTLRHFKTETAKHVQAPSIVLKEAELKKSKNAYDEKNTSTHKMLKSGTFDTTLTLFVFLEIRLNLNSQSKKRRRWKISVFCFMSSFFLKNNLCAINE